jgi:hypothetical protein
VPQMPYNATGRALRGIWSDTPAGIGRVLRANRQMKRGKKKRRRGRHSTAAVRRAEATPALGGVPLGVLAAGGMLSHQTMPGTGRTRARATIAEREHADRLRVCRR